MTYKFEKLIVSFGSNTNLDDLNSYAKRNGFPENCFHFEKVIQLPDQKLAFDTSSNKRGGGVLNIQPAIGHITEAALFSTTQMGLEILRKKEGVPFKYEEKQIIAIDHDGSEIPALTYIVKPELRKPYFAPSDDYLNICRQGYEHCGIDTENLFLAAKNETLKPLPALFAYGTLMRGEERFPVIEQAGLSCALTAVCFGSLSTNGNFPALDLLGEGYSRGDYFLSNDISALLRKTDSIEGFVGFGSENNFFRRTCVDVDVGGVGQRPAWLYTLDAQLDKDIEANDWRDFTNKRNAFSAELVRAHASKVDSFYEGLTQNYFRFGRADGKTTPLSKDEVIKLLFEDDALTEMTMAQVSNCWTALTNMKEENV